MPRYKDFEEWQEQQQARFKLQIKDQLPEYDLRRGEPLDYPTRKIQDTPEPVEGFADQNALYDFVGNVLWGFGETFMVPTVLDIASEVREEGVLGTQDLSAVFGSQDWKDDSWSGRTGYIVGTAGGILTGIGAVGKGLQLLSKTAQAGTKMAAKKLASESAGRFGTDIAKSIIKSTRANIDEAAKVAKESTNFFARSARRNLKRNPLGDDIVYDTVNKSIRKDLIEKAGFKSGDDTLESIVATVMREAAQSRGKHFGHSIGFGLKNLGMNPKLAQVAGDMVYEAALLGAWDTIVGEIGGDLTANLMGLDKSQWGFDEWYHRAAHGMLIGSVLAPIRYLPGGKQVAFGKTGMMADINSMRRFITARFGKSAEKMTDNQLRAFANSLANSSGGIEMFDGVQGMTKAFLKSTATKDVLSSGQRDTYIAAYNAVKADLPRLARKLGAEVLKDGKDSFFRASVGSFAMNASAYKQAYDYGLLFTEDYPMSKLIADHWVGMLYMKRGKTFEGSKPMPRFYDQTGIEANGSEIARMLNAMDVLGKDDVSLNLYTRFMNNTLERGIEESTQKSVMEGDVDARQVVDTVRKEFVTGKEYIERMESDPELNFWSLHAKEEVSQMRKRVDNLREQGKTEEADALDREAGKLADGISLAGELSAMALFGYSSSQIRPMYRKEAIDFVKSLGNIRLDDGTPLTTENFGILENRIEAAKERVTKQIRDLGVNYINESLQSLGLLDATAVEGGRLIIHKSVMDALFTLRSHSERNKTTGEKENPYGDAARTLIEAIENAKGAGVIEVGEPGIEYISQDILANKEGLNDLLKSYNRNTETLHEIVFNSANPESSWREHMPGWTQKEGFFDPGILGATPIWHAIQTANRYKRNRLAYEGFSDQKNEFYQKIHRYLKGSETFRVVDKIGDEIPAELSRDDLIFHNNLTHLLKLLNREGNSGVQEIETSRLKTISEETFREFGNILSDPSEFTAFNHFLYKNLINDMTGNATITTGLKNVIKNGLHPESLLTIRDNGLVFRTAHALRMSLSSRQDISDSQRAKLNEMIGRYETEIEIPLRKAMKNGNMIRFADREIDTSLPGNDSADLIQNIQESLNQVNKFSFIELGELGKSYHDIGTTIKELTNLLVPDMKASKELELEIRKLGEASKGLSDLMNIYIGNRDVIGLRYLLDSREALNELSADLSTSRPKDTKSIQKYKDILEKYINNAIDKRNETLEITDMAQLDDFYQEKIDRMSLSDRSDRPHQGNTSISVNQYESKWHLSEGFAKDITDNPRRIMDALGLLADPAIGRSAIFARELFQSGVSPVLDGIYNPRQYVDIIVKPIIESMRAKIEAAPDKYKGDTNKGPAELYEDFVIDTYFIVQSAFSSKKLPVFTFENGVGNISETNVSNWDVGINRIARVLGLKEHGSIFLFGSRVGTERGFTSNLTPEMRAEMFAMLESGTMIDLNTKDVLRSGDVEILEKFKDLMTGRGIDGRTQFIPVQLDEKTLVVIPAAKSHTITRAWHSRDSELRLNLEYLLNTTVGNATRSREMVEAYLGRELGATFNDAGEMSVRETNPNIQKLVMLTRVLEAFPDIVPDVINNRISVRDGLSRLKYIKMDSPRGGMALNARTLDMAREFLPRFLEDGSNLQRAYDIFNNHFFDAAGNPTEHRTLNLFDETGVGGNFFSSTRIARRILDRQILENNPDLTSEEVNSRVEQMMEGYDRLVASVQNAEKYLALPEMVSQLMVKGARRDWFVWDAEGNPVGFNVVIKPIEMYANINRETGEITTSVGKTAYKFHPEMDNLMNINGDYFLDSIGMESAHKVHRRFNAETNQWESPGIHMEGREVENWQEAINFDRASAEGQRMNIDRGGIFIKSISGIHDATISFGFSNLLSNNAQRHLNNVTGIDKTIEGMTSRYAALADNPFAYKLIAQQLLNWQGESGDAIGRITGVEAVLSANGLPLFEFMMPHVDRMVTSEYMGTRNLTSSTTTHGNYNTMTSGPGYSMPERRGGMQYTFGGSGIPWVEWNKPITELLTKGGEEGLSFIFKATPELIKKFNLGEILESGNDILVTHDGEVMSPHLHAQWADSGPGGTNVRRIFENFVRGMNEYHAEVIRLISEQSGVNSLGDAALFLNGTFESSRIENETHKLNNKLNVTPSQAAMYNKIKEGDKPLFQSIHLENTDLRTPKVGLNDWVITRIEKLLDRRRGPISEMNLLDVIDPQDADFDLDKSSSLFALPGKVLREIYNVSGYFSPARDAFDTVLEEVIMTESLDVAKHSGIIKSIEKKRPRIIRQQSILSNLLQFFSTRPREGGQELFVPGDTVDMDNSRRHRGFFIAGIRDQYKDYEIRLREGAELTDSMGYMKNLIKATLDIYKTRQTVKDIDLDQLLWEHPEFGLLKVIDKNDPNIAIPWSELPSDTRATLNKLKNGILKPIGEIYNLNRMTENFSDGTSRSMTGFEMVYKYEKALTQIRYAGLVPGKEPHKFVGGPLEAFSLDLLKFLGDNRFSGEAGLTGLSEQPLIKALVALRKGMNKSFMGDPATIPHDSGLAEILAGKDRSSQDITDAIAGILADEKNMAQITAVQYRSEQIKDIISNLRASRRLNSSAGKYWEGQFEIHQKLINEFNTQINDPSKIYENRKMTAKPSSGKANADYVTRVYREIKRKDAEGNLVTEVVVVKEYQPGEQMYWKKGDVLVENPKTLVAGNDVISRSRRAMHDAFARIDNSIDANQYQIIEYNYNDFIKKLNVVGSEFSDPKAPKTSGRQGMRIEAELSVLADALRDVGNISPDNASNLQKQFLFRLLTPDAAQNVYDIVGWNPNTKKRKLFPHFNQNKRNEALVFKFMNRAMSKNAEMTVSSETAGEWFQVINDRFKAAYIRQYSPTIEANVFNFEKTSRLVSDFSLLPKSNQLPKFVYDINVNEKAKDILQSYLNGTFFLDPIETYRLSYDLLNKSFEDLPNLEYMGNQISKLWQGTDNIQLGKGEWFRPSHTFRQESYHTPEKSVKKETANDFLRRQFKECF